MPTIPIYPPTKSLEKRPTDSNNNNPLPQLLQTPSGLALIELQGSVNTSFESSDSEIASALSLGRMVFPGYDPSAPDNDTPWNGDRVFLYIGKHQRMSGEVKKLSKPIAILRRRSADDSMGGEVGEELEVAEIVRFKVLFAQRPEPVGTEKE